MTTTLVPAETKLLVGKEHEKMYVILSCSNHNDLIKRCLINNLND